VTGSDSYSVSISGYRMDPSRLYGQFQYINTFDEMGVEWISRNVNLESTYIYADSSGGSISIGVNMLNSSKFVVLSNITSVASKGIVYLDSLNLIYGIFYRVDGNPYDVREIHPILDNLSMVYSDGNCAILKNTG
jgi:hypothetical protein